MRGIVRDRTVLSPNGSYRVEMDSPDNALDSHTQSSQTQMCELDEGSLVWGAGWRSPFRYRLLDTEEQLWERWTPDYERYAQDIYVDDSGWVVLLTYGDRYQLLQSLSPTGEAAVRVVITDAGGKHPDDEAPTHLPRVTFDIGFHSTAGMSCQEGALPFFHQWEGRHYFWLLTPIGQRIVLSLDESRLLDKLSDPLEQAFLAVEAAEASKILSLPLQNLDGDLLPVIAIAIRQRLVSLLPQLERQANLPRKHNWLGKLSRCLPAPFKQYVRVQPTQILTLALRHLGGPPPKQPSFRFFGLEFDTSGDINTIHYLECPEFVSGRDSGLGQLHTEMTVPQVLKLVGCPDEITEFNDENPGEHWEYYQTSGYDDLWASVCLSWEAESGDTRMRSLQTRCYNRQDIVDRVAGLVYRHSLVHRIISLQPTWPKLTKGHPA